MAVLFLNSPGMCVAVRTLFMEIVMSGSDDTVYQARMLADIGGEEGARLLDKKGFRPNVEPDPKPRVCEHRSAYLLLLDCIYELGFRAPPGVLEGIAGIFDGDVSARHQLLSGIDAAKSAARGRELARMFQEHQSMKHSGKASSSMMEHPKHEPNLDENPFVTYGGVRVPNLKPEDCDGFIAG